MRVTLYYVVLNIGFQTVLALVIAVMMQRLTQKTWLRGIVLTPYLVAQRRRRDGLPLDPRLPARHR